MTATSQQQDSASSLKPGERIIPAHPQMVTRSNSSMEKEFVDRAKAIRQGILQLRDSL